MDSKKHYILKCVVQIAMCLVPLLPAAALASGTADFYMSGSPAIIQVGQDFTLDFTVTPANGAILSEASVGIPYSDSNAFQLVSINNSRSAFDQTVREGDIDRCLVLDRKSSTGVSTGPSQIASVTILAKAPGFEYPFALQKIGFSFTCDQYDWGMTTQNYMVGGVPGSYFNLTVTGMTNPSDTPSPPSTPVPRAQPGNAKVLHASTSSSPAKSNLSSDAQVAPVPTSSTAANATSTATVSKPLAISKPRIANIKPTSNIGNVLVDLALIVVALIALACVWLATKRLQAGVLRTIIDKSYRRSK